MTDGLVHLLRREAMGKGVGLRANDDGSLSIELHIVVDHGVNIAEICRSIMHEVRYMVQTCTGTEVRAVNVYIDSMMID